jgi:hypothetical protein
LNKETAIAAFLISLGLAAGLHAEDSMLPDPKLTPGKVARAAADRGGVTEAMERKIFNRYRIPWTRRPEFKVDHLIPVELGGADSLENLWPQSLNIKPYGAHRKELLTERLLAAIASGRMTVGQAQEELQRDWIDCFINHLGMVYLR